MQTRSKSKRAVALLFTIMMAAAISQSASAQTTSYSAMFGKGTEPIAVNVLVGQSRVINFDRPIGRFSVSNPEIAEAVLVAPDQVLVNGKGFGQVNFIAWEQSGGRFVVFDVYVRTNLSLIDSQIRALFPKDDIRLSQANGSVVLSGNVKDRKTIGQAQSIVEAAGFKVVNMIESATTNVAQVQLEVHVAEVSKSRLRDYGTAYTSGRGGSGGYINSGGGPSTLSSATVSGAGGILESALSPALNLFLFNSSINTTAMIRALRTSGAIRSLAEPNLVAMDGQQASFLAGGEFPIPIVQNGGGDKPAISIVFKEYGIRLNFKPTIIDEDHIRLDLEPEVSTIDFSNGVKFSGFTIPALKTRRAHTGVELRDGQSFALAGLLDNNETKTISTVPFLSDIPILGALFKSKSFQKDQTELMFIMTAHLVKPVNQDDLPSLRGMDGLKKGSLLGVEPKGEGIEGKTGYSIGETVADPAAKKDEADSNGTKIAPAGKETAKPASEDPKATDTNGKTATIAEAVQPGITKPKTAVEPATSAALTPESATAAPAPATAP
jgi:pilus assembly protein CpaC